MADASKKQQQQQQRQPAEGKGAAQAAAASATQQQQLKLRGVIGFNGTVAQGFLLHADDQRVIYPLGSTIVVRHLLNNTQQFLAKNGHDASVSCLTLSPSGKMLASGQQTVMGFPATVIVWDLESESVLHKLSLHKGKVEDLSFSHDERFLVSLGGADDRRVVVWDLASGEPICGAPVEARSVRCLNTDASKFVTVGQQHVRVWTVDNKLRKLTHQDCVLGSLRRVVTCVTVDKDDRALYCGTSTGDLLEISLEHAIFRKLGQDSSNRPFSQGIQAVLVSAAGELVVGTGSGVVAVFDKATLKLKRKTQIDGFITALQPNKKGDHFFIGTRECNLYLMHLATLDHELRTTCHQSAITDVAFPIGYSALFATCAKGDIRVWQTSTRNELLRICVPNQECLSLAFQQDGKAILSGWDDGKVRAFGPQSGKLLWVINDAHRGGVTALAPTKDSQHIVTGGVDGSVRVWLATTKMQKMLASMKEHKSAVNSIVLNEENTDCISAADDGSCIEWSLSRFTRTSALFASTQFKAAVYHPDQSQILTTGTDRKITYWDVSDAAPIRIMDGSPSAEINSLAISADGTRFVSAGGDKLVRLWGYDEGTCAMLGVGHSGSVTKVRISPDEQYLVSVGQDGGIFIWDFPPAAAVTKIAQAALAGKVAAAAAETKQEEKESALAAAK